MGCDIQGKPAGDPGPPMLGGKTANDGLITMPIPMRQAGGMGHRGGNVPAIARKQAYLLPVATTIVFETHALSEDNERGVASGWAHSQLSARGRRLAEELGERRRNDGIATVFSSDLRRAVETTAIAFPSEDPPVLLDWRLRECDYGDRNGTSADAHMRDRASYLDQPYPNGESWGQAIARVARWLDDLTPRWTGARVLVIGHVATRWALDHYLDRVPLETLVAADFAWRAGWEYRASA